ncbi:MAG TPA: hypothetical protein VMV43_02430 [Candidatus Nanopelagicaceae bacterium]|nr:hypothetical protein [Candidatus Nanopelagicaceae bacterium]
MLFQLESTLLFILWLILATVVVFLIMYIAVLLVVSKTKASDKWVLILVLAFIAVLILPVIVNAIMLVLNYIGGALASLRSAIDGGGQNFLGNFAPIIFFLFLLAFTKFLVDISWEQALWVSLLTLFILYVIYSLIPELYNFVDFG